jgi:hypothetical protein
MFAKGGAKPRQPQLTDMLTARRLPPEILRADSWRRFWRRAFTDLSIRRCMRLIRLSNRSRGLGRARTRSISSPSPAIVAASVRLPRSTLHRRPACAGGRQNPSPPRRNAPFAARERDSGVHDLTQEAQFLAHRQCIAWRSLRRVRLCQIVKIAPCVKERSEVVSHVFDHEGAIEHQKH